MVSIVDEDESVLLLDVGAAPVGEISVSSSLLSFCPQETHVNEAMVQTIKTKERNGLMN